jgi:hypothetical protein
MATKSDNIFHCKNLQKFTQIGISGLKIYHLANLIWTATYFFGGKGKFNEVNNKPDNLYIEILQEFS